MSSVRLHARLNPKRARKTKPNAELERDQRGDLVADRSAVVRARIGSREFAAHDHIRHQVRADAPTQDDGWPNRASVPHYCDQTIRPATRSPASALVHVPSAWASNVRRLWVPVFVKIDLRWS